MLSAHEIEQRLTAYATELLRNYTAAIDANFALASEMLEEMDLRDQYLPLYGRQLGVDTRVEVLYTLSRFYLFFMHGDSPQPVRYTDETDNPRFADEVQRKLPSRNAWLMAISQLGLQMTELVPLRPGLDGIYIGGTNFLQRSLESIVAAGVDHGTRTGNHAGELVSAQLPQLRQRFSEELHRELLKHRFTTLCESEVTPQRRGQDFELIWRDVLDFFGWHPHKFRLAGEENDFTALYQGLHILGEVRWYAAPMSGGKMREFLGKLDPRPQTIGLFISYSGLDEGAWSVIRRSRGSKTVVIFDRLDIEAVLIHGADPGELFSRKLRETYDYIFEKTQVTP
jgi:hypothetical protein